MSSIAETIAQGEDGWRTGLENELDAVSIGDGENLRHVLRDRKYGNLLEVFLKPRRGDDYKDFAGAGTGVAEGVNRTTIAVCTFAFSEFVPLPFRKDFVFAFEDVDGLVLVLVGVGWGAAAGW